MRRLVLLVETLGVLVFGGGCSSLIYYAASLPGREAQPQTGPGLTPDDVKTKLGKPIAVRQLPDGGQVATYRYRQRDQGASDKAKETAAVHAALWLSDPRLGLLISPFAEPVFIGMAIYRAAHPPHGEVTLTYGPDGRVLGDGAPPPYGSAEDALEPPSIGAHRRSCWSRDATGPGAVVPGDAESSGDERAYIECVVRRFAVWGID